MLANIPAIRKAIPMREISREVQNLDRVVDAKFIGCTPDYLAMNHLRVERGRSLTEHDLKGVDNVAVLAHGAAAVLFPIEDPIGRAVLIDKEFYIVIGVAAERTAAAAIGGSLEARQFDSDVYIPLTTFQRRVGDTVFTRKSGSIEAETVQLSQITAVVQDMSEVDETADIIRSLLAKYHKTRDYSVVVPKELLQQAETLRAMFNVLLLLIAGISLLVGGIGIMNIMLATVTERTREIGIRRALGATKRDIIQQFLWETVVLSGTGGLLGILFGFMCKPTVSGVQYAIVKLFPGMAASLPENIKNLEPRIAPWSILVALVISVAVGMVFGLYPARRAANMDPIEALRHE
jgi:putative ABC transport system permease protein